MSRSRSAGTASNSAKSQAALAAHPRVAQAVAVTHTATSTPSPVEGVSDKQLVGYVVLDQEMMLVREPAREAQLVEQWHGVYEDLYSGSTFTAGAPAVLGEDFAGWNSSYTGAPIPLGQMREWQAAAVNRIMALQPQRVLEIGVGSGLLLAHVAPACVEYWGTDFSAPTIQTLQAAVAAQSWGDRVRLRVQPADVADGLPEGHFDVVVLNSVVQYFPSAGYLLDVLAVAMRLLAPGGALFIGDVRNLSLLRAFTTGMLCADTTGGEDTAAVMRERVRREMLAEQELLLAPEFFAALPQHLPDIAAVEVQLKQMGAVNELSCYRYEVVLRKAPVPVRSVAHLPSNRGSDSEASPGWANTCSRSTCRSCASPGCLMPGYGPMWRWRRRWPRPAIGYASASCVPAYPHPMRCCRTSVICWGRNSDTPQR